MPAEGEAGFEDGTVNYLAPARGRAGAPPPEGIGIDTIHTRVACLTGWLLEELAALRHGNGAPVVQLYGPKTMDRRGGTVAFNFLRPTDGWSTSGASIAAPPRTASRSAPAASATPGPGSSRSASRDGRYDSDRWDRQATATISGRSGSRAAARFASPSAR